MTKDEQIAQQAATIRELVPALETLRTFLSDEGYFHRAHLVDDVLDKVKYDLST